MSQKKRIIALILVAMMVMGAGCAGWGTDGPAGEYADDNESDGYGDEEAQYNDSNESNDSTESSYGSDESDSSGESESDESTETGYGSSGESDTGAQSDSETSDDGSGDSYSSDGDSNEKPDEPPQTGDGGSQPDTDSNESDSGPYTYSLTVQVVDEDGNPVENELVQFDRPSYTDDDPVERITDGNGEATFQYEAETEDEYMDYSYIVRGERRGTERVDVGEQRAQVVVSDDSERETYELEVYVDETQPIAGVDVTIERWDGATTTKTTSERARVTFDVYPGEYRISATYAGQTHSEVVTVEGDKTVFLPYHGAPNETATAT